MRSPGHRLAALAFAVATASAWGCTGEDLGVNAAEPELEPLRLGRVHVVLEPEHDPAEEPVDGSLEDWDAFEVTARFAFVRGLEEDFVRARIDMPVLPSDVLPTGSCMASEQLSAAEQSESSSRGELLLVDAGDLRMQIGSEAASSFEVPVSLVPDLLPYMSGVEYLYYAEELPSGVSDEAGGGGGAAVVVESKGSPSAELPAFRAEGVVPSALALHVGEDDLYELRREALVLRWQGGAQDDDVVTLRITGLQGGEPIGTELTCVVADRDQTRLSFDTLRPHGLMLDAEALRVTMSRLQTASFDAGDFVGSELIVERREEVVVPLR